jgi:hypothetical protein
MILSPGRSHLAALYADQLPDVEQLKGSLIKLWYEWKTNCREI